MPTETVCPACGAPVQADTAFCGECDSLVSSAADRRPAPGAPMPPTSLPPASRPARARPVVPSEVISCWSCDANNPPGRMFCVECGSFIAIGTKVFSGGSSTRSVAAAMAGPASAVAGAGATGTAGTMPLGSYAVAMASYERTSRRRLLLAAVSLVLVAVVGLSAIYAALTRHDDGGLTPAAALLVAPTASPIDDSGPVEESVVAPETQPIEEVAAETERATVEPASETAEADVAAGAPETQPIEEVAAEIEREDDPPAAEIVTGEFGPTLDVAAESPDAVEVVGSQGPAGPATAGAQQASNGPVWRDGWVCDGELSLKDERLRDWAITRVSFLPRDGFERVALQLQRVGNGSGGAATLTAEAFPTARVKQEVSAVRQPSAGRTTVAIEFRGGVRSHIGLRRYQPSGLGSIKEFNAYPVGQTSSRVLVSSSTNGCFKVRAPAFNASPNAQRGQLLIDIKS